MRRWLVAALVLLLSRGKRRPEPARIVAPGPGDPRAELAAVLAFLAAGACATAFVVVYAVDSLPRRTQLLGLSLGLAFAFLATGLVLLGKRVVTSEEVEEDYPPQRHAAGRAEVEQIVRESRDGITRRRLLKLAGGGAGLATGLALIAPAVSLGPVFDVGRLAFTPWRRGRRLVDERGRPYRAAEIEEGSFYTAYPEAADREQLGAPLVVVRLPPDSLRLPAGRRGWAPGGIVAYSKICTHAGCAISLYRTPLFDEVAPATALVCPCHYSTFDPARGGAVTFGPAGRRLPQLPLAVDRRGILRAGGTFSGAVGPSWWGVRSRRPRTP